MDILNGENEHLWYLTAHGRELSLHLVFPDKPVISLHVVVDQYRTYDVNHTKLMALCDVHKFCVFVFWQNHAAISFLQEEDVRDFISFKVDVLIVSDDLRLKKGTDPGDERAWLTFQEIQTFVCLLVDVYR